MMKRPLKKRIESTLGAYAVYALRGLFLKLSPEHTEKIGRYLGKLIYRLSKRYRRDTLYTLKMAFPDLLEKDLVELSKKTFEHFGIFGSVWLNSSGVSKEALDASLTVEGIEHLKNSLKKGKGLLILSGHLGNWEKLVAWSTSEGYPIHLVARNADHPKLTQLMDDIRGKFGAKLIAKGQAIRPILAALSKNEIVGILADQNSGECFIPFFNKPCGTTLGPGVIQQRTGCAVITAWCLKVGLNQYRVIFDPEILEIPECDTKGEGLMRVYNQRLEAMIRKYPEQWLWLHDRWRYTRLQGLVD